jgi:hypothetical protein
MISILCAQEKPLAPRMVIVTIFSAYLKILNMNASIVKQGIESLDIATFLE